VVAVIGPFNFPGHLPNGQIVPALLLGNCVVHKPSEKTPSTATLIARCLHEAGVPPGVFSLVQGPPELGAALTRHSELDGILFTGSATVGQRILEENARRPECLIALELGGKNAAIALDDCDLERTARALVFSAFATAGQRCTSTSRLIATRGIADALVARVAELARTIHVGHPFDPNVFSGPLISERARTSLGAAQARARAGGYETVLEGGACEVPDHDGHYVRPAIHRARSASVQVEGYSDEELFGPDLAVYQADDLEHALALAESTRFGLAASVFTGSREAFERAADVLRVGVLHWNRASAGASGRLPFGGLKRSGNHRPAGILMGTSCTAAQGVLLEAPGPLPTWPGISF
jgi:succinylglutamic semialdehyde dehydrogenase